MDKINFLYTLPVIVCIFSGVSYYLPFALVDAPDNIFLTLSIFLFATLSGFFISRQSIRYDQMVRFMADFDGTISYLYRSSSVLGSSAQEQIGVIANNHYSKILATKTWQEYFGTKSTTLTDINNVLEQEASRENLNGAQMAFVSRAYFGLGDMQKLRKNMIVLFQERIPSFQWFLMDLLASLLLVTVLVIPTQGELFQSLIKGAFAAVVVTVLILLRRLNEMTLFEEMTGHSSARDVLDIIEGTR